MSTGECVSIGVSLILNNPGEIRPAQLKETGDSTPQPGKTTLTVRQRQVEGEVVKTKKD